MQSLTEQVYNHNILSSTDHERISSIQAIIRQNQVQ